MLARVTDPRAEFGAGWQQWNPQAFLDWLIVTLVMSRLEDVIPKTYIPILRLVSEDPARVDEAYHAVLALREPVRPLDSPRERWRKRYGRFVRELEWVYGELGRHFPEREYQELAVDIMARTLREQVWTFLPDRPAADQEAIDATPPSGPPLERARTVVNGRLFQWIMKHFSPMSFMVGPMDLSMGPDGAIEMFIPRCWWHTSVGDGRTQDESCVYGCKGGTERLFARNLGVKMLFEPHLPEHSCTVRVGGEI